MKTFNVAVIAGDGVGKEVVPEGIRVLERVGDDEGLAHAWLAVASLRMVDSHWGAAAKAIAEKISAANKRMKTVSKVGNGILAAVDGAR